MLNSVSGEVEDKILYHYTNVKGLMGILDSQCLWATDFRYTNDLSEIRYAKGIMMFPRKSGHTVKLLYPTFGH